jgi:hypothetical protein
MSKHSYENAIISFLDILGFGSIVLNSAYEEVRKTLNAIEYFSKPQKYFDAKDFYKPIVHIFSDTIIRIRPVERKDNRKYRIGLLFHELLDLLHIQGELIGHGALLRGAVSFGKISISKTQIFGPGLIRAYELEKNCAIYPRIIVDPDLIIEFHRNRLLRSQHNTIEYEKEYISNMLRKGDDAFWFIDYLRAFESELDEQEMYPSFLSEHKKLILDRAQEHQLPRNVIQKFLWLVHYHNQIVNSLNTKVLKKYGVRKDDLLILASDIANMADF